MSKTLTPKQIYDQMILEAKKQGQLWILWMLKVGKVHELRISGLADELNMSYYGIYAYDKYLRDIVSSDDKVRAKARLPLPQLATVEEVLVAHTRYLEMWRTHRATRHNATSITPGAVTLPDPPYPLPLIPEPLNNENN